jgi:serine/threonine protein kinase
VLAVGTRVGKYELTRSLGQGGFGEVFVARDRDCALKFLLPEHTTKPEILQRFLQEARSAAKIDHGGIVTVFECGQVSGTAYIAMELLKGESLAQRIARGRLDSKLAVEIVRQLASALGAAHEAGIVHRDLKPDNVFLVPDTVSPIGERVKILDFGIAKLGEAQASSVKTASMMIFGTPRYMSPEQCRSTANVDARTDIYALGVMFFEMLCGEPPFPERVPRLLSRGERSRRWPDRDHPGDPRRRHARHRVRRARIRRAGVRQGPAAPDGVAAGHDGHTRRRVERQLRALPQARPALTIRTGCACGCSSTAPRPACGRRARRPGRGP